MATRKFKTRSIDTHDFTEHATLRGVITKMEDIVIDDEPRATMVIDTGKRLTRVFHSKALEEAFDVAVIDDCIEIEFLGTKRLSAKKTFKRFSVQVWTGDLDDEEEKASAG